MGYQKRIMTQLIKQIETIQKKETTLLSIDLSKKLTEEIRESFKPGDMLASQVELTERFGVSRAIIRGALEILETTGVIQRVQGKGAVVVHQQIGYPIHRYTRFTEILEKNGRKAETRVLRKIGIPADKEVAHYLEIEVGEPVVLLESLGKMDGAPISRALQYFPLEKVYDVMRIYDGGSLHQFIFERYNMKLRRVLSLINAQLPHERDCSVLKIENYIPILQVKSVNIDENTEEPIEYVDTRFKSTAIQLSFDLSGDIIDE